MVISEFLNLDIYHVSLISKEIQVKITRKINLKSVVNASKDKTHEGRIRVYAG